ncbi:MAG: M23 family metallopeptidase [bacterium]
MVSPIAGPVRILSPFGPRGGENHDGIDMLATEGTPVRTVAAGQITFIQDRDMWERRPRFVEENGVRRTSGAWRAGVYLEITHDDGRVSRYMHLHDLAPGLVDGMRVQPKQVIGYVGRTAVEHSATHLHFEIRERAPDGGRYGDATDPLPLIDLGAQAFVPDGLMEQKDLSRSPGGPELQQAVREKLRGLSPLEKMDRRDALRALIKQLPLAAPVDDYRLSSTFGRRIDPATGEPGFHPGVDMPGPLQTPVKVTAPGTVVFAGWRGFYGRVVEVDHGNGIVTRYGHLYSALVRPGQQVGLLEKIGEMGNSGRSTGEHLHYEVLVEGEPQDPLKFLQAGKFLFKG